MKRHPRPAKGKTLTYLWYIFVPKNGEVIRHEGTEIVESEHHWTIMNERLMVGDPVPKSEILDRWAQDARTTSVGETRIKQTLRGVSQV
jgi:hypothetical protein